MVFGKPYIELFGEEKLMATPAFRVLRVAPETIFVQLTPSIRDCELRHDLLVDARRKAIRHLGETAFMASTVQAMGLAAEAKRKFFFCKPRLPPRRTANLVP
jgi:hypothetical protein